MTDSWNDMKRAKEEQYFEEQNKLALARVKQRGSGVRTSPVSGKPMQQITIQGVVVDRCPESGGIWLDAGELEQIIAAANKHAESNASSPPGAWLTSFFDSIFNSKK